MVKIPRPGIQPKHFLWRVENRLATISLNRPERKNPLTFESYKELIDTFQSLNGVSEIKVLVITGAGDGFCSGADLAPGDNPDLQEGGGGIGSTFRQMRVVGRAALRLHQLPHHRPWARCRTAVHGSLHGR